MIQVKRFVFNAFGVNGFVLCDETGECLLVDTSCVSESEKGELDRFLSQHHLRPVKLVNTHLHIDHVLGNNYLCENYSIGYYAHRSGLPMLQSAPQYGAMFGIEIEPVIQPVGFLEHGDEVKFGNSELKIRYTPGHADGSICLVSEADKFVITGDVLFQNSIGRTDLPTGNLDVLRESIYKQLFTLPDDFRVLPGHGPDTSIGYEKLNNPFI